MTFTGVAIGAVGQSVGEVVFNTAITGYQEILTDPSYAGQIITLTHPHIGNTGVNPEDEESCKVWAAGLVIRDLPLLASSWRKQRSLSDFLKERSLVAIAEIDTRKLTRVLRDKGSLKGCILTSPTPLTPLTSPTPLPPDKKDVAIQAAKDCAGLKGKDLAKTVTTKKRYTWEEGSWRFDPDDEGQERGKPAGFQQRNFKYNVVVYDFGVKQNILRLLVDRDCALTVVPAETTADEVLALKPDGVFLSSGPGDPAPCDYAITAIRRILETKIPVFGICLGLQLLGLAAGMKTKKMNVGHHGANHPVKNLADGTVLITSQNHGFCIDEAVLPDTIRVTHRSLFDNSIQGVHLTKRPAFGFQGHPEASPGPHDARPLFDHFVSLMDGG